MFRMFAAVLCLMSVLFSKGEAGVLAGSRTGGPGNGVVSGVIIIKFKSASLQKTGGTVRAVSSALRREGVGSIEQIFPANSFAKLATDAASIGIERIYYGTIPGAADPVRTAQAVSRLPGVEYAEPKYLQTIDDIPNDPLFAASQSSYYSQMSVQAGWALQKGSASVIIADVDGGTYWQHEDLQPNLWINSPEDINHNGRFDPGPPPAGDEDGIDQDGDGFVDDVIGWNFGGNNGNPVGFTATPQNAGHGTATASHFGALTNNGTGIVGTSWNCKVMPINAGSTGSDNSIAYGYEGIAFAAARGAKVINCSWGRVGDFSQFEHEVIKSALAHGALVVAAAGNNTLNTDQQPHYPGSFPEVLGVGALDNTTGAGTGIAYFTDYGVSTPVYAPGVNIYSALNGGGYGNAGSGTSFASPLTAGLAGLLFAQHPEWTPRQIATQIRVTADPIDAANSTLAGSLGHGRVNFQRALGESHPGLEITDSKMSVSSGRGYFLVGDTVHLSVTVKNILPATATGLQFSAAKLTGPISIISGSASVGQLAYNQSVTLPDILILVGAMPNPQNANVVLRWTYNSSEADAFQFGMTLFNAAPDWVLYSTPAPTGLFSIKAVNRSVVVASGGNGGGTSPTVVITTDGGTTWNDITGSLSGEDLYCVTATDAQHIWTGTGTGRIYATTNGGATWSLQAYPGTQSPFIDGIWFFDQNNGVAIGDPASGGVYVFLKTTNGGATWAHGNEPVGGATESSFNNSFWWTDQNHGWFGTNNYRVWRTTNGGGSWSSTPVAGHNSVGVSFGNSLQGTVVHDDGLVATTGDGGSTWIAHGQPIVGLSGVSFVPGTATAWAVSASNPIESFDGGGSWTTQTAYPFSGSFTHVTAVDTDRAFASTSFGQVLAYQRAVPTDVKVSLPQLPVTPVLEQNYPNPFNPTTRIAYVIPAGAGSGLQVAGSGKTAGGGLQVVGSGNTLASTTRHILLTIYDLLGREVAVLADGEQSPGRHEITFNAGSLTSGVYFCTLRAGLYTSTIKMLLMK
jgi:photosystem II stability/assembly factor-like uncharacterized protein